MEKPSPSVLACFKFIYNVGKLATSANSTAIAYLDSIKSGLYFYPNVNALKPDQYQAIIDVSKTIYQLLKHKPLEINILNDALDKAYPILRKSLTLGWSAKDPDTGLEFDLSCISELYQAAAFLIATLFEQNKLKEADIAPIAPINGKYCDLATTLFSDNVLQDIRPEFKKNAGDTTFADVIRIFEQKYLGKPVIKDIVVGGPSELSDFLNDIVKKCWARIKSPEFADRNIRMIAYHNYPSEIYSGCLEDNRFSHEFFVLKIHTTNKGVYKSFNIAWRAWNRDIELYYRNGKDIKVDDITIEGLLYAHFKLCPK